MQQKLSCIVFSFVIYSFLMGSFQNGIYYTQFAWRMPERSLRMIDFHAHILPGIDDGSRDTEMSQAMLEAEMSQGVNTVVLTPHFYAHRRSIGHFLEKRQHALEKLQRALGELQDRSEKSQRASEKMQHTSEKMWQAVEQQGAHKKKAAAGVSGFPHLRIGAEVYYFEGMGRADQLPQLCIEGTDTILVEMPFEQWHDKHFRDLKLIIEKQHLQVVLAHIERYPEFQKDKTIWERVFAELPVTPQINTGSFLKKGGLFSRNTKKKFCLNWLKQHSETILGSDAHNLDSRKVNLAAGREIIQKELGEEALRHSDETARRLLAIS